MSAACTLTTYSSKVRIAGATLLIGALLPVVAAAQSGVQPAVNTTGSCQQPTKVKFIGNPDERQLTSETFANLVGATISFTQGGTSASCVIVSFSSEYATSGGQMVIGPTLDNVANAFPLQVAFAADSPGYQTHAASFIFPSVAPGAHVLRIRYRNNSSVPVFLRNSTTMVHLVP